MKKRRLISLILILLIVLMSLGLFHTNAKYTSIVNGNVTTSVAKYVFNVTATDSYNSTDTIDNLIFAQTCDEKTLINGKIAPGTSGSFDIVVDSTGAEVGINYEISFSNNTEHDLPKNLVFTLDGENWNINDKITGRIDANEENKIFNHTILWSWAYETADDEGNTIIGDMLDTNDGKNAFDYSFTVTATGTQAKPLLEGEEQQPIHKHNYDNLIGKTIIDNKVYCDDDCDGIDVTVIVENKNVKINNVIYNISNNVIVDKHTTHTYEGATLIPNGSDYKVACTECGEETIAINVNTGKTVNINGTIYNISGNTVVNKYNHKHNYDNLIGQTIINNKVYCSDDCDGIDVTVVVENKTVKINNVIYNISNNVIVDKHTTHTYEGATLIPNGSSYKIACTECKEEITGIKYENNGEVTIGGNTYSVTEDTKVIGNKIASYVVKHWQQNVTGTASSHNSINYTLKDTQNLKGEIGESITPLTKTYTGFNSPLATNTTIKSDRTTEVNYYYTRKSNTITLNKGTGISATAVSGNVSGNNANKYLYGETVTIDAEVSDGYSWLDWDGTQKATTKRYSFTMPSTNVTCTANARPNTDTIYTVNYWQQNVNGVAEQYDENNYTKYETKTYTGTTGTSVIAKLEEYEGFITPEEQSAIIFGNGSTVIDYYYVRNVTVDSIAFITEWTLTSDNTTITLPIKTAPNITIDWGDGTVEEKSSTDPKHTYIYAGVYNIRITGNLPSWDFERHSAYSHKDNNYITGITQWGEVGFTSVNFYGCSKLKNIPEPTEHSFDSVIDFSNLFNNCTGLEGNIPENLFKNCINANNFVASFKNCTGLTGNIPEGLFANCTKCKRYGEAFSGCTGLTGNVICDNIFNISAINSTSVAAFNETFKNCTGLTSANINNNKIQHTFEGCTNLTDIILGDNVSLIYTNSFYVPSNTQTVITTNNDVVLNYDWSADNRTVTFK